jgi:prolyl 4-hydroxylase
LVYQLEPWVVVPDKFLSDEERNRLIQLDHSQGYERSMDVGELNADGSNEDDVNEGRTSTNAWCQDDCYEDPIAQRVMGRISNVSNTPETDSEYLKLLKYEVGQHYQQHHDYIKYDVNCCQQGPRILTLYMRVLE